MVMEYLRKIKLNAPVETAVCCCYVATGATNRGQRRRVTSREGRNGTSMETRLYERLRRAADEEARALLRELPPELWQRVRPIPIQCEPRPSRAQRRAGVDPDLMGLFEGEAFAEQTPLPLPPTIFLFLENIYEEAAHDAAAFRDEVRRTLMHEYGHFLGLDEDDLLARGVD